jgi:hypothetical protein
MTMAMFRKETREIVVWIRVAALGVTDITTAGSGCQPVPEGILASGINVGLCKIWKDRDWYCQKGWYYIAKGCP